MGKGRKAKPTKLKILQGNPGGRPLNKTEPKAPQLTSRDEPDCLGDRELEVFRRLMQTLENAGILTELDLDAVVLYCQHYARWLDCNEQIKREGLTIRQVNNKREERMIRHPLLSTELELSRSIHRLATEFGMTPSARTKLHVDLGGKAKTPEEELLFGGQK